MKKIISILSMLYLSTIISTNIISCNSKNIKKTNNKPHNNITNKSTESEFTPPENSNWKLINNFWEEAKHSSDNKWYVGIYIKYGKTSKDVTYWINKFNNITKIGRDDSFKVYRWDGVGEPTIPTIDKNIGKIIDWNKKTKS
ncbi:hypothetical protein [Spiroplasma endosymbiont of Polydrusus pterygomalis]|uniref:hypothetical protein n=1 Tax=Spiroplasma endosymbiont of Polydrusus pterygomalis TaxID=3139327 RepID=UPI003CCB0242